MKGCILVVHIFPPLLVPSQLKMCGTAQQKHLFNLKSFIQGINQVLLQNQDPQNFKFHRNWGGGAELAHFKEKRKGHFLVLLKSVNNILGHLFVSTSSLSTVNKSNITREMSHLTFSLSLSHIIFAHLILCSSIIFQAPF